MGNQGASGDGATGMRPKPTQCWASPQGADLACRQGGAVGLHSTVGQPAMPRALHSTQVCNAYVLGAWGGGGGGGKVVRVVVASGGR